MHDWQNVCSQKGKIVAELMSRNGEQRTVEQEKIIKKCAQ